MAGDYATLLAAVALALAYSAWFYAKAAKARGEEPGETFKPRKMVRTALIGVSIGLILWWTGTGVTLESVGDAAAWAETAGGGFLIAGIDQIAAWIADRLGA